MKKLLIVLKLVGSIVLMIGNRLRLTAYWERPPTRLARSNTVDKTNKPRHRSKANTNKAVQIDESNMMQDFQAVDLSDAPRGLTIEAITQGSPIGSVRFQFFTLINFAFVDNKARYFACGNNGTDILLCDIDSTPTTINGLWFDALQVNKRRARNLANMDLEQRIYKGRFSILGGETSAIGEYGRTYTEVPTAMRAQKAE
jgi:hypothetical protein